MCFVRALCVLSFIGIINVSLFASETQNTEYKKVDHIGCVLSYQEIHDNNTLLKYIQMYDIFNSKVQPLPARVIGENEILDFPRMSPLFMPLVFNSIHRNYRLLDKEIILRETMLKSNILDSLREILYAEKYVKNLAKDILLEAETRQIGSIRYDQKNLPKPEKLIFQIDGKKPAKWTRLIVRFPNQPANTIVLPRSAFNPWLKKGNVKLQFSQTYVSPNWSKGGESNMAGLASIYMEANYRDLKNIEFNNNFEVKVVLNTVTADSLRNLNVSIDQLRLVSNLGIKMHDNWYYSLSGEFITPLLNNYKKNSRTLMSSFFSPAKLFVSLGIDYKKSDSKKGYDLSLTLSPLTYKLNYLYDNVNLVPSSYGIKEGKHFGNELGSKISSSLSWKLSEKVYWKSKFYYFTDYNYSDSEWENTLDLNINNYFSIQMFLHMKLDDRIARNSGDPLLQIQELLSFGLVYRL